jgi:hypothetical protein
MRKRCPNCALHVRWDEVKCHHCGAYVSRSLAGLIRPDRVLPPWRMPTLADLRADLVARRRRALRISASILLIAGVLLFTWREQRRNLDPAAHPLPTTFEAFEKTFGPASDLTPEQKDLEFERYKGKYVRWEGILVYLNAAEGVEPHASLRCGSGTQAFSSDVTLYVRPQDRDRLAAHRIGDRLTCAGSLVDYGQDGAPVVMQDGRIIR